MAATPLYLTRPDSSRLAYYRLSPQTDNAVPGVVFLGGFRSDMTGIKAMTLERWCGDRGLAFVRFDYFGHGRSDGDFEYGTIGHWAADAVAVIDKLTSGPQLLVGSSMGGWIMLLAALARTDRIAGLVGIASAPDFTEDLVIPKLSAEQRKQLDQTGVVYQPSAYDNDPYPISQKLLDDGGNHSVLRGPLELRCPLRLLHGMRDPDVPYQTSQRLAECYAGDDVRLVLLKDAEHRLSRPQDLACVTTLIEELL